MWWSTNCLPPQRRPYQIPGVCECDFIWKKMVFAHVIRLRILKWRDNTGLSGWALNGHCQQFGHLASKTVRTHFYCFQPASLWYIFFLNGNYLFIYLWLCWVFVSVRGLSLSAASGGHSSSRSLTIAASLVVEHRLQTCRLSSCGSRA